MSRRVRGAAVGLVAVLVGTAGISADAAEASEPVLVRMNNFRYCSESSETCFAQHQAYVANPTTGEPLAAAYNPLALIDVHAGDAVTFRYEDGPAGATTPLNCDSFNGGPVGIDLGIEQLRCPGHAVVLASAGPGGVQERLGFVAREHLGEAISWTVPAGVAAGTLIPFFCDVGNGIHYRVGMTGALRVVA